MILVHLTLGQLRTPSSCQHFCCCKTAFRQRWLDEECLLGSYQLRSLRLYIVIRKFVRSSFSTLSHISTYQTVRLVFRPYAQVGRSICTSEPLRPSTGLFSGFSLPMCSSPSFGCFRLLSGRGLQESPPVLVRDCFRFAFGLSGAPQTRACVRLLGPCFKTGRRGDSPPNACISGARYSCLAGAGRPRPNADEPRRPQRDPTSPHFRHTPTRRSPICPPVCGRPSAARQSSSRRRTKVELALTVSFDFGRFRVLFDSLFRVLRSTCSLSVSRSVSSLGWSVPPCFGLRSQATLLSNQRLRMQSASTRTPAMGPTPALGTAPVVGSRTCFRSEPTISVSGPYATIPMPPRSVRPDSALGSRSTESSLSLHSPLLRESQLVSLPPLSNMLKFSG